MKEIEVELNEKICALYVENEKLKAERNRAGVEMRNAVAKAVREEREACAKVCDTIGRQYKDGTAEVCAETIRARSAP